MIFKIIYLFSLLKIDQTNKYQHFPIFPITTSFKSSVPKNLINPYKNYIFYKIFKIYILVRKCKIYMFLSPTRNAVGIDIL